jgi:hypothetical protein
VEDTQNTKNPQDLDPLAVKLRTFRLGVTGRYLAKKMNRSGTAITNAFRGESVRLLRRIDRHLDWLERKRARRAPF